MSIMFENSERLHLPQIKEPIRFTYAPDFQNEWVHVGLYTVSINKTEIPYFLDNPDELIRQLKESFDIMNNPKGQALWRGSNLHLFHITQGIHYPLKSGHYKHERYKDDIHLTVTEVDPLSKYREVAYSHYIRLDEHENELMNSQLDLTALVREQVERGVSQGVAKAIQESTANLKQVHTEKQRIDQQIAELQRERERIEAIEKRLEEKEAQKQARKSQPKSRAGYVYVVRSLTAIEYYKIGRSATPEKRMKQFEVNLPFEIEPICLIQTDDMYNLESELHQRFADKRAGGEFFLLTKADLDYIKSLGGS